MSTTVKSKIFHENILHGKITLKSIEFNKNLIKYITAKLVEQFEGKFSKHGYIRKGSISVLKVGLGKLEPATLSGLTSYQVQFRAEVCSPVKGNIVLAEVQKENAFGLMAVVMDSDDKANGNTQILKIIIPRNSDTIESQVNLSEIKIGHKVYVKLLGIKAQLNDTVISCIGNIVKISGKDSTKNATKEVEQIGQENPDIVIESGFDVDADELPDLVEDDGEDDDDDFSDFNSQDGGEAEEEDSDVDDTENPLKNKDGIEGESDVDDKETEVNTVVEEEEELSEVDTEVDDDVAEE